MAYFPTVAPMKQVDAYGSYQRGVKDKQATQTFDQNMKLGEQNLANAGQTNKLNSYKLKDAEKAAKTKGQYKDQKALYGDLHEAATAIHKVEQAGGNAQALYTASREHILKKLPEAERKQMESALPEQYDPKAIAGFVQQSQKIQELTAEYGYKKALEIVKGEQKRQTEQTKGSQARLTAGVTGTEARKTKEMNATKAGVVTMPDGTTETTANLFRQYKQATGQGDLSPESMALAAQNPSEFFASLDSTDKDSFQKWANDTIGVSIYGYKPPENASISDAAAKAAASQGLTIQ